MKRIVGHKTSKAFKLQTFGYIMLRRRRFYEGLLSSCHVRIPWGGRVHAHYQFGILRTPWHEKASCARCELCERTQAITRPTTKATLLRRSSTTPPLHPPPASPMASSNGLGLYIKPQHVRRSCETASFCAATRPQDTPNNTASNFQIFP